MTGIGGAFFRARDPDALPRWYWEHLGINPMSSESEEIWWQEEGPTVWSPFPADTDYFGRPEQSWMIDFRVRDLDATHTASGCRRQRRRRSAGDGGDRRFGWAADPEGNRFELWEPAPESLKRP